MNVEATEIDSLDMRSLMHELSSVLSGHSPDIQAVALADALAVYLCGWPREARAEILDDMLAAVRDLVPVRERQIFGPAGHPSNDGRG